MKDAELVTQRKHRFMYPSAQSLVKFDHIHNAVCAASVRFFRRKQLSAS